MINCKRLFFVTLKVEYFLLFIFSVTVLHAAEKTYTGVVTPVLVQTIASGAHGTNFGSVKRVEKLGSIITPSQLFLDGKTAVQGTIVLQQGKTYYENKVIEDAENILIDKQNISTDLFNYQKYLKLCEEQTLGPLKYEGYFDTYVIDVGKKKSEGGHFISDSTMFKTRTMTAPFEGYVSKVMYVMGMASGCPPTVEITQLNPIGIKVEMSRDLANNINANTPVTVFLPNSNKKVGVYNGCSLLQDDGILFLTDNYQSPVEGNSNKSIDYKITINDVSTADSFYVDNSIDKNLCVPVDALKQDGKSFYVWRAKDQNTLLPGKISPTVFQVEKVSITPGNKQRFYAGNTLLRMLTDSGKLKKGDLILSNPPKELKDGDNVGVMPNRYTLMPGERVKIVIGE